MIFKEYKYTLKERVLIKDNYYCRMNTKCCKSGTEIFNIDYDEKTKNFITVCEICFEKLKKIKKSRDRQSWMDYIRNELYEK